MIERIRGGWKNVPQHLRSKTQLSLEGLTPTSEPCAEVWSGFQWTKLYDSHYVLKKRVLTPKQLDALEKARGAAYKKYINDNSCSHCGELVGKKDLRTLPEGKKCTWCIELENYESICDQAADVFRSWFNEDIVILDTETTCLERPEIVEIGIIDKNGMVLFESLIKPIGAITDGAREVHGIDESSVANAPSWNECYDAIQMILKDRHVLCYNDQFDTSALNYTSRKNGLEYMSLTTSCIMNTYRQYMGHEKWLSLSMASGQFISHRAVEDCKAARSILLKVWDELNLT